jgi:hypothetical protein
MIGQLCRPLGSNINCEAVAGVNFRMRRRSPRTLGCPCGFGEKHKRKGRSYFPEPRLNEAAWAADASRAWKWRW